MRHAPWPCDCKVAGFFVGPQGRKVAEFSLYTCDLVVDWLLDLCNHGGIGNPAYLNLEGATL